MAEQPNQPTRTRSDLGFHFVPPADGATAATIAITRRLIESYRTFLRDSENRLERATAVRAQWREAINREVGAEQWKRLLDYSRHQRRTQFGLDQFVASPEGWAELATSKRRAREQSVSKSCGTR